MNQAKKAAGQPLDEDAKFARAVLDVLKKEASEPVLATTDPVILAARKNMDKAAKQADGMILVSFGDNDSVVVPINSKTGTMKDVKEYLSWKTQLDPKSMRLMDTEDTELKVVKEGNLISLSESGVGNQTYLKGFKTISKYAGQSDIKDLAKDAYGNAIGEGASLGLKNGCKGYKIGVIILYPFDFSLVRASLVYLGFEVIEWGRSLPSDFESILSTCSQLWVVSDSAAHLSESQLEAIRKFHLKKGSLYLLGDNDDYNVGVNPVINKVLPGTRLAGNDPGGQILKLRNGGSGSGFLTSDRSRVFTGLQSLHEGCTIARIEGMSPRLRGIFWSSSNQIALAICDDNLNGCGRIAIDTAFTKFFPEYWKTCPGTATFVQNIAVWLCMMDDDWA
jgi:hypothetical protein